MVDQACIFDRFDRAVTEEARCRTGTGLPTARALVELHGRRVWLECQPGARSVFWIAVPLPADEGTAASLPKEE